jgi:hypothetical protein
VTGQRECMLSLALHCLVVQFKALNAEDLT